MFVLTLGILLTGVIGLIFNSYDIYQWFGYLGSGITSMGELIIITMMAGGLLAIIKYNGGITYIINLLIKHVSGKRGAEMSIGILVALVNICTANNTVAIITTGNIAKQISDKFNIDPRKAASILDTFSCSVQGLIPYGAQILMTSGLTNSNPLEVVKFTFYPMGIALMAILAIVFRFPRKYSKAGTNVDN